MAITKIMTIGETLTKGGNHSYACAGEHLKNGIKYIINPDKTEDGALCGSNVGVTASEIYDEMIYTKKSWNEIYGIENPMQDKLFGRQGYHFVISFAPGECDKDTAFQLVRDFCEEYLGDQYEYVYSVHTDQKHMHAHLIFNSVSRTEGFKWRYEKGDWEKSIQPITDRLCTKYGLSCLVYDEKRKGKSYAEHKAEKEDKMTDGKILRNDIDYCISKAWDYDEFLGLMNEFGYQIREGYSRKFQKTYLTFKREKDGEVNKSGKKKAYSRRDYKLGRGYSYEDIQHRILTKEEKIFLHRKSPRIIRGKMNSRYIKDTFHPNRYQIKKVNRLNKAGNFYALKNPFEVNQNQVRKDMRDIGKIREECQYLAVMNIDSVEKAVMRMEKLKEMEAYSTGSRLSDIRSEKRILYRILREEHAPSMNRKSQQKDLVPNVPDVQENPVPKFGTENELLDQESEKVLSPEKLLDDKKKGETQINVGK